VSDSTVGSAPKARRVTAAEREAALEELACRGEADATQFCQSSAAMRALTSEELSAQLLFQLLDGSRERRLRDVTLLGGTITT